MKPSINQAALEGAIKEELALLGRHISSQLPTPRKIAEAIGKAQWTGNTHLLDELFDQIKGFAEKQRIMSERIAVETFYRVLKRIRQVLL